jgi:cysteinyl-tRNA synthetase
VGEEAVVVQRGQADAEPDGLVVDALADDMNTSSAIARLHALATEIRGRTSGPDQIELKRTLKASGMLLGLLGKNRGEYLGSDPRTLVVDADVVNSLIAARTAARARKDFTESDRLRDELVAMGVVLKDGKGDDGKPVTTWEIAR